MEDKQCETQYYSYPTDANIYIAIDGCNFEEPLGPARCYDC
jgi:hypothetical protein